MGVCGNEMNKVFFKQFSNELLRSESPSNSLGIDLNVSTAFDQFSYIGCFEAESLITLDVRQYRNVADTPSTIARFSMVYPNSRST